jgi:hypothetical protein
MDLVRELKGLNARKKAGENLSAQDEARRKELKIFLRTALESQGGAGSVEDSAITAPPQRSSSAPKQVLTKPVSQPPAPASSSAPKPVPTPTAKPASTGNTIPPPSSSAPATKATPRPVSGAGTAAAMSFLDEAIPPPKPTGNTIPPVSGGRPAPIGPLDEEVPPPSKGPPLRGGTPMGPLDEDVPKPGATTTQSGSAPKPYTPRKDFFAIDAGGLLNEAANSEAVAKVDPLNRKARASRAEVEEAEAKAEAALRATKKRERPKDAEEAVAQLKQVEGTYTPPEESFIFEQYYGGFEMEGYTPIDVREAPELKPIDPREIELSKLDMTAGPGGGATTATVPPGLAFLDDFPALYAKRIVPAPDDEVVIDSNDPNMLIPGKRKVTVHLLNGEKRQGAIRSLRRGELGFKLEPIGSGLPEEMSIAQVKAVFIHLQPNAQPKEIAGRNVTATFRDGRSVQGQSDDYQPGLPVFTLVPPAGRGQFERIIVNAAALQSVQ